MNCYIYLPNNKTAIVSWKDYTRANAWVWKLNKQGYVYTGANYYLHRFIMNTPTGMQVDHINGDKLDNRRSNLRNCTNAQNSRNRLITSRNNSGYKGVHIDSRSSINPFVATIKYNGHKIYLGSFPTAIEAAKAYNIKALELFGAFARLNPL